MKTFKRVMMTIGAVLLKLIVLGMLFGWGTVIGRIFYENTDWWYSDPWMLGAVVSGFVAIQWARRLGDEMIEKLRKGE